MTDKTLSETELSDELLAIIRHLLTELHQTHRHGQLGEWRALLGLLDQSTGTSDPLGILHIR